MKKIAVIGSGISGLAAAYYLSRKHEVWLFEKESRLGGHTHTVTVESSQGPLRIDTGFIVHNDRTYPNLVGLFNELGVETAPSDMSFAVTDRATGFEYSSRGLNGFFAQRKNAVSGAHYRLLKEILRFNREAPQLADTDVTLGDFVQEHRYDDVFVEKYLYPMASAVWSMSPEAMASFPAATLIQFFQNHGMLGINTHPKWKVLKGGSNTYLEPLTAPYRERIFKGSQIGTITRAENHVVVDGRWFDEVVFACHGNQILPMLADATPAERDVLQNFQTTKNDVCLHTDSSLLPKRPQSRASWNYNLDGHSGATVTYHMNRLQNLPVKEDYCVTLNANGNIRSDAVLRRMTYYHPLYTREAIRAQARWKEISGVRGTHFCGAYWFYGFHEDGLNSALRVARALGVDC
jgi:predicted NAD/FAD-binding protein